MNKQPVFTGVATALITPMLPDGGLHLEEFRCLIEAQIDSGVDALVVCGTTGESATLSDAEKCLLFRTAAEQANGRVPIIAGVGGNNTAHTLQLAANACRNGANALLVVTPYYNKTSQEGLLRHYEALTRATPLPIIPYEVPSRTGMRIALPTLQALAQNDRIIGFKDAAGSSAHTARILAACGPELPLYAGNDFDFYTTLALGGSGIISVASNLIPKQIKQLWTLWQNGQHALARQLQFSLFPLLDALFEDVNPMPIKYAMNRLHWQVGPCRMPLIAPTASCKAAIDKILQEMELT